MREPHEEVYGGALESEVKRHGGEANSSSARLPEIQTPKHYPSTSAALEDFTPTPVGVQTASR